MDLITESTGSVWILAGRLSWLRELQLAIVLAVARGREVKILCSVPAEDPQDFYEYMRIAAASGAKVAKAPLSLPGLESGDFPGLN